MKYMGELDKISLFEELKVWDDAIQGDCDETLPLQKFYLFWAIVCELGIRSEYEAWAHA